MRPNGEQIAEVQRICGILGIDYEGDINDASQVMAWIEENEGWAAEVENDLLAVDYFEIMGWD